MGALEHCRKTGVRFSYIIPGKGQNRLKSKLQLAYDLHKIRSEHLLSLSVLV